MMPGSKDFFQKNNKRMSGYDPFGKENSRFVRKEVHAKSHVRSIYISSGISTTLSLTASVGGSTIL